MMINFLTYNMYNYVCMCSSLNGDREKRRNDSEAELGLQMANFI